MDFIGEAEQVAGDVVNADHLLDPFAVQVLQQEFGVLQSLSNTVEFVAIGLAPLGQGSRLDHANGADVGVRVNHWIVVCAHGMLGSLFS